MKSYEDFIHSLVENGLLAEYQGASDQTINNFLQNMSFDDPNHHKQYSGKMDYKVITPNYIKSLIEIDEAFRASTEHNTEPVVLYRGARPPKKDSLSGIVSTSLSRDVAVMCYKGALYRIDLPAGSPYIKIFEIVNNLAFKSEEEIILPPCDFEIVETGSLEAEDYKGDPLTCNCYKIVVKPKNLAECFLERMKNPPENYLKSCSKRDLVSHARAMAILEDYVENYVKKNKFQNIDISNSQPGSN